MASTELLLRVPETGQAARIEVADAATERRLLELAESGQGARVSVEAVDADVEGHTAAADTATVRLILGTEDDTEGHVLSLRFPNVADAEQFRKNLATGVVIGALALAGAGAAATGFSAVAAQGAEAGRAATGISNTQPNVHADQAMPAPGVSNVQPNVHADQAMPAPGVSNVQPNVHADQAMPPERD
jgi:hypothetical protein